MPSQQNIWDPYGPHVGIYMGPIWANHMGPTWVLQPGSIWDLHGQAHMGGIWEPYGPHMGKSICFATWTHLGPIWANTYGTHMGPLCVIYFPHWTHIRPLWALHGNHMAPSGHLSILQGLGNQPDAISR